MPLPVAGQVGPSAVWSGDGANIEFRQDKTGALSNSPVMGKYFENTYRGLKFCAMNAGGGQTLVAVNLFSTAIATFQPIMAIYNPITNNRNFAILQAWCGITADTLATAAQTGPFLWVGNAGQLISNATSVAPVSCNTLKATGSTAVVVNNAVLTGAVGVATLIRPVTSSISQVTATANASAIISPFLMEEVAGSFIVPPGGYLAFANGISSTVGVVTAGMVWDELPL